MILYNKNYLPLSLPSFVSSKLGQLQYLCHPVPKTVSLVSYEGLCVGEVRTLSKSKRLDFWTTSKNFWIDDL